MSSPTSRLNNGRELMALPSHASSITRRDPRSSNALAVRSSGTRPKLPYTPLGILALQDKPTHVAPPQFPRELDTQVYVQVKNHIKFMMEHPVEKTLQYKVAHLWRISRSFVVRTRVRGIRAYGVVLFRAYGFWKDLQGYSMEVLEEVRDVCRDVLETIIIDNVGVRVSVD